MVQVSKEKDVRNDIKKFLTPYINANKLYVVTPMSFGYAKSGVPDLLICARGLFIGVEVKADMKKNKPTTLQLLNLQQIELSGGVSMVVDKNNVDVFSMVIRDLLEYNDDIYDIQALMQKDIDNTSLDYKQFSLVGF